MKSPDQVRKLIDQFVGGFIPKHSDPGRCTHDLVEGIKTLLDSQIFSADVVKSRAHYSSMFGSAYRITVSIDHTNGMNKTWQYMHDLSGQISAQQSVTKDADEKAVDDYDRAMMGV